MTQRSKYLPKTACRLRGRYRGSRGACVLNTLPQPDVPSIFSAIKSDNQMMKLPPELQFLCPQGQPPDLDVHGLYRAEAS